jgi:hypothetical protein
MNLRQLIGEKPILRVPNLRDLDDYNKENEVRQICRKCAEQLAPHLFRWEKSFPSMSTVKSWDKAQGRFVGMDLDLFQSFIEDHFSVRTADNKEWRCDRVIADRIWSECVSADSPLPEASFAIEAQKRQG